MSRAGLLVVVSIAACKSAPVSATALPTAHDAAVTARLESDASAVSDASGTSSASRDASATSTAFACDAGGVAPHLSRIACVEPFDRLEGRRMGFSVDGRYLGFCISVCDACPTTCTFEDSRTHGKVAFTGASAFEDPDFNAGRISDEEVQRRVVRRDAPMTKFLARQGIATIEPRRRASAPWPYPDLVLATRGAMNEARGTTTVELGGSVGGGEPVFVMRLELGPHPMWKERPSQRPGPKPADVVKADAEWRAQFQMDAAIAAVVDVTPDGKDIGLVGYASGTFWFEDARVARMPLSAFAAACRAGARDAGVSAAPPPPRR